jgi:hypothetical protein
LSPTLKAATPGTATFEQLETSTAATSRNVAHFLNPKNQEIQQPPPSQQIAADNCGSTSFSDSSQRMSNTFSTRSKLSPSQTLTPSTRSRLHSFGNQPAA